MKVDQTTVFTLSFVPLEAHPPGFSFGIPAVTKEEAMDKLSKALAEIQEELKRLKGKVN